ncbi:hypothetical protein ACF0H5_009442 [Mactra antiquata]
MEPDENNDVTDYTNNVLIYKKEAEDVHEPRFDNLDRGWSWIVLAASFCTFMLMGATQFASGIVYMALLDRFQASTSLSSLVCAVHISMISIGAPLSSYISDRYSCRTAIVSSGILFFIGLLGTAFAPNIEFVLISYGLVAGIGGALGYTSNMVVVALNFQRRRNLALGIAVAGAGLGICVLATVMQNIYDFYKSTGFFMIMAGIYSHEILFGLVCFPSDLELYSKRKRENTKSGSSKMSCGPTCHTYTGVFKNISNICLCIGMFTLCLGTYLIYLHLPNYIVLKGFSSMTAANLVSISGIASVFGRLMTGFLANLQVVNEIVLYSGMIYVLGVAVFIYPAIAYTYSGNMAFSIVLGFLFGNVYVLSSSVTVKFVGITNVLKALGLQFLSGGIGALLGPLVAGKLYKSCRYMSIFHFFYFGCFLLRIYCSPSIYSL